MVWNETLGEIHVQLMGEIQLEVLKSLLAERYGLEVSFGPGGVTLIAKTVYALLQPEAGVLDLSALARAAE